jgi:hypothetical protein
MASSSPRIPLPRRIQINLNRLGSNHTFPSPGSSRTRCTAAVWRWREPIPTIEAWKRGEAPSIEEDRILTAEDVSTLDLKGTWLVTLSACDTGAGEARAGEGVMGLRRGFVEAGAQNLLMTLWPISDEVTRADYERLLRCCTQHRERS